MSSRKTKVMIGMSGGVDSSVAALRLIEQGYDVEGLFMKNWEEDDDEAYCAAAVDLADAQSVADQLGIKLHTVNFSHDYWDRVFSYFLEEYRRGRTPNPDILCNREIKFKAFLDHALSLGAEKIATGHYAAVALRDGAYRLLQAADADKDQTYFLYMIGQAALSKSLFPLGDIPKHQVREIATNAGFVNDKKKDSTGICFIGERRFRDFLSTYLPATPGPIEMPDGTIIGEHHGAMYYTLGQRQGLGIGGVRGTDDTPWFVVDKDVDRNVIIVAQGHDNPLLLSTSLSAEQPHWTTGSPPATQFDCLARSRHRQPL
ncbi:MAG: tRNA 2-thiouridine(34) synthase MnmA, partial [bacterium]